MFNNNCLNENIFEYGVYLNKYFYLNYFRKFKSDQMLRGNLLLLAVIGNILAFEEIPGLRWIFKF